MSKQQTRRKIALDSTLKQVHSNPAKDAQRRPSVFERLGTKAISNVSQCQSNAKPSDSFCRQWEQNGTCQYGKTCKYVSTHALISPSKRAAIKDASSKINIKSCSSSSSSGSSSTGSDSTTSEDTSSSGSSESVDSSQHHHHKEKHMNSRKLKRYSSSSDKEHTKKNNVRTGKGISPGKKSSHGVPVANVGNLSREMKHSKKRRSRDRSDVHGSPRKMGLGTSMGSKKSSSPPLRNSTTHKRRSISPSTKGFNNRNSGGQHIARSPSSHKDKHNRSVSPRSRERDRVREKEEKERERERDRDREIEKEREKDKRTREREREPEKLREREKDRDKEKDRNRSRSPKIKLKDGVSRSPRKEIKRKESPDHHIKPNRLSGGNQKVRDDTLSVAKLKGSMADNWHRDARKDDKDDERKRADERRHKEDLRKDLRLLPGHDDKEHIRERERDRERDRERIYEREREKEKPSKSMLPQGIPSLLTLNLQHNPSDYLGSGIKDRTVERNRSLERTGILRNRSMDRGRERSLDRVSERSRGSERDRRCRNNNGGLEKGLDHSGLEKELAKALARNREQDRTFERNERMAERGLDRGHDRIMERGLERGLDRGLDRGIGLDRNLKGERGLERVSPRVLERDIDRGLDRGLDRDPVLGRLERGLDRGLERGSPRIDRDHRFTEIRSPGERLYVGSHLDHGRESDEKGYENACEGRRERGRFSDPGRFEKGGAPNDDRRMGSVETVCFNEERSRRARDCRPGQWEGRNERKRDRDHHSGQRPGPQGPAGPNNGGKRNDWEWDGRGRRPAKDWDGPHRAENDKEWGRFPGGPGHGPGDWAGPPADRRAGGWNDEWRPVANQGSSLSRPLTRMLPVRDDAQSASHKSDDHTLEDGLSGSKSDLKSDTKSISKPDVGPDCIANPPLSLKRVRETVDGEEFSSESKRSLLEKDSALEEVLSDISDDADEILNREDSELSQATQGETSNLLGKGTPPRNQQVGVPQQSSLSGHASSVHSHHRRTVDGADGVGSLGFEEISDGELEEEARARGISDALGVDWASLVAETRPRAKVEKAGSIRQRWEGVRLLTYIGVSVDYAGPKLVRYILDSVLNLEAGINVAEDESYGVKVDKECSAVPNKYSANNMGIESNKGLGKQVDNCDFPGSCKAVRPNEGIGSSCVNESDNCDKPSNTSEAVKMEDSVFKNALSAGDVRTSNIPVSGGGAELSSETKPEALKSKDNVNSQSKIPEIVKMEGEMKAAHELKADESISRKGNTSKDCENLFCEKLLHPVAGIHTALLERRVRRQALFGGSGPYKQALSARRDLSIRRQLCNLSPRETTCDNGPAVDELFRLSLQLLERAS